MKTRNYISERIQRKKGFTARQNLVREVAAKIEIWKQEREARDMALKAKLAGIRNKINELCANDNKPFQLWPR